MSTYFNEHAAGLAGDRGYSITSPQPDIIGALLQALNGSDEYKIVHVGGELFLEPQALRMPRVRGGQAGA
jgi:hypothetical protein